MICVVATAMVVAALPAVAQADVVPTALGQFGSNVPGAHGNYTVTQTFQYNGGAVPVTDDLKDWVIDAPAGLVGNPNAIDFADRCTPAQFAAANPLTPGSCPASSVVGSAQLNLHLDSSDANVGTLPGVIYLLQTSPEVPTTLATRFTAQDATGAICGSPGCFYFPKTQSDVSPVTGGDWRLRTIPKANVNNSPGANVHQIVFALNGLAPNGKPFLTNPTRCDAWTTYTYAEAVVANSNADSDPTGSGSNNFKMSAGSDASPGPDCSTLPNFSPSTAETFSTYKRNTEPTVKFSVATPGVPGVSVPRKVVTTLPASMSINAAAIPIACKIADRNAGTCPASAKVGTVQIAAPEISAGLSGDVYMVEHPGGSIPDLSLFIKDPRPGGISARIDAVNDLVGGHIISTFDNLPQLGFSSFDMTLNAGNTGFLKIKACPSGGSTPLDGPITYNFTSYAGQTATIANTPKFARCVGATIKAPKACVKRTLKLRTSYLDRAKVKRVAMYIDRIRVLNVKKSPFKLSKNVKHLRAGKHRIKVRVVYKGRRGYVKKLSFTKCHRD